MDRSLGSGNGDENLQNGRPPFERLARRAPLRTFARTTHTIDCEEPRYCRIVPATDDRAPGLRKASFDCPNCGAFAHQTWCALGRDDEDGYNEAGEFVPRSWDNICNTEAELA
ncbi:hypothetical protein [uncultured Amnibacterium sp.]|uniref:hypothetical protein n=1 Tax=uncultured Amnibacterium sp. TaxID=1631851 RepID=UPI0035C9949E